MGMMNAVPALVALLREAVGLTETVAGNKSKVEREEHAEFIAVLDELGREFEQSRGTWFDSLIDGLNRLPRPVLACGTLGLLAYAMADPVGFAQRMVGLELVPEPLWWLVGAIVSFYFGAREMHYLRKDRVPFALDDIARVVEARNKIAALRPNAPDETAPSGKAEAPVQRIDPDYNPVIEDWLARKAA